MPAAQRADAATKLGFLTLAAEKTGREMGGGTNAAAAGAPQGSPARGAACGCGEQTRALETKGRETDQEARGGEPEAGEPAKLGLQACPRAHAYSY